MNRAAFVILAAALAGGLYAQDNADPKQVIAELKQQYTSYKNNLIKAAEKMPEDAYSFKPTDAQRTWGELMLHIAGQFRPCGVVKGGEQKALDLKKTSKADIVAALKESFDVCDAAWDSVSPANAHELVSAGRGAQRSKISILIGSATHDAEEYGYAAVYMRVKGVTPPSSEGR
jgi:hypothetical protein